MKYCFFLALSLLIFTNCKSVYITPTGDFEPTNVFAAPDYSKTAYWAALPTKKDAADNTPKGLIDEQANAAVDVFFLYPTRYVGDKGEDQWIGPVDDPEHNKKVDVAIGAQASIFNGVGKVYVPRYREAHINTYFIKDEEKKKKVFDLAYQDVKNAFQYYLDNYNNGRPIIIASHSQGTTHSRRLIKEFFDGKKLMSQFVVGYLVGMPVLKNEFEYISVCQSPTQTGCFNSWQTFEDGHIPNQYTSDQVAVTNPISWTTDETQVDKSENKGTVFINMKKKYNELVGAKIVADKGILWVNRPKFFGNFLLKGPRYHVADLSFFYFNVRENAQERAAAFLKKNQ